MNKTFLKTLCRCLLPFGYLLLVTIPLYSDDQLNELNEQDLFSIEKETVIIDIGTNLIFSEDHKSVWASTTRKVALIGRPVPIKLKSDGNSFTFYLTLYRSQNGERYFLLIQSEVWLYDDEEEAIQYFSDLKNVFVNKEGYISFIPFVGKDDGREFYIKMGISLKPISALTLDEKKELYELIKERLH